MTGGGSSIPKVQRLLAVLATGRRAAEVGTAFGEGADAIASTAASLVTVEIDPETGLLAAPWCPGVERRLLSQFVPSTTCPSPPPPPDPPPTPEPEASPSEKRTRRGDEGANPSPKPSPEPKPSRTG